VPDSIAVFLSSVVPAAALHEVQAFGPGTGGFSTGLVLDVRSSVLDAKLLAAVDGQVWRVPPTNDQPATLYLKPLAQQLRALSEAVSHGIPVFVYRGLNVDSLEPALRPHLGRDGTGAGERLGSFLRGEIGIMVKAGDELGLPLAEPGPPPAARLTFEVVLVPSGLGASIASPDDAPADANVGKPALLAALSTDSSARRLDPLTFYQRAAESTRHHLLDPQLAHPLFAATTRRTLLELRNDANQPFVGLPVRITTDGARGPDVVLDAATKGFMVLDETPAGAASPPTGVYEVLIANHRLAALESASSLDDTSSATLHAPAQWSLQAVNLEGPTDASDPAARGWFCDQTVGIPAGAQNGLARFTEGNVVTALVDGTEVFDAMERALETCQSDQDTVRLAGWCLHDDVALFRPRTLGDVTRTLASRRVPIRALIWEGRTVNDNLKPHHDATKAAIDRLNALRTPSTPTAAEQKTGWGVAVAAGGTVGAHHQKLLLVRGTVDGVHRCVAFCGGVDLDPTRVTDSEHGTGGPDAGWHDVHAQIEGPAVAELDETWLARWRAPTGGPTVNDPLAGETPLNDGRAYGSHFVQVTRTYARDYGPNQPFAPNGDLSTLRALMNAVRKARRFIYIEDQYIWPYTGEQDHLYEAGEDIGITRALADAVSRPGFEFLFIVIPNNTPDTTAARYRRARFIAQIRRGLTTNDQRRKFAVFWLRNGAGQEIYVHAKTWIIDDVYVKIGSSNCNRRSLTNDSELDIHVVDAATRDGARVFARDLRIKLWAEHLGLRGVEKKRLEDPTLAAEIWRASVGSTRVQAYNSRGDYTDPSQWNDPPWNSVIDPDGR
jgi:phosphatidylserine/phosphatidylglycerophosphate/cardiolipin synthase-like enzyme